MANSKSARSTGAGEVSRQEVCNHSWEVRVTDVFVYSNRLSLHRVVKDLSFGFQRVYNSVWRMKGMAGLLFANKPSFSLPDSSGLSSRDSRYKSNDPCGHKAEATWQCQMCIKPAFYSRVTDWVLFPVELAPFADGENHFFRESRSFVSLRD